VNGPPATGWSSTPRSLRRDRALARLPRALAGALAAVLILAGLRTVVFGAAPAPLLPSAPAAATDLAAEGFAAEVATLYLGYDAGAPDRRTEALRALVGEGLGADLGMEPPARVSQRVRWARAVQDQEAIAGGRLITVAVQTDRHGLLHLSVPVRRDGAARLALAGYPALVGAPEVDADAAPPARRDVADDALRVVAARAVGNYLARDAGDLQADLAPGARVALPALALAVQSTLTVTVAGPGGVLVTVQARDPDGGEYTLTYELGVVRAERWYVSSVQAFPNRP
jgi:hypothetical protein